MGILDTLNNIKKEGYDPKTDSVSTSSRLAEGNYPVRLKSAQAGQSKGTHQDQVAITLEVVSGPDKNRLEIIYLSFNEELPEFVLEKNGRILLKIAAMVSVKLTRNDLDDEYSAAEALSKGIGKQFKMELSISPNKKNPQYPYRNYEFELLNDTPNDGSDIPDDDLPF